MADRLSQLQDAVNMQAENLYNSIGCLFNSAPPCSFDKSGKTPSQNENPDDMTEHKRVFATLIARNAKDIDALIESLPSEDSSAELQIYSFAVCFIWSQCALVKLMESVRIKGICRTMQMTISREKVSLCEKGGCPLLVLIFEEDSKIHISLP
ncbi:mediator of RNA polymerase II transcription subunit 21-like [Penaeus indicus]|uniref:mediator of RNA polymerase II transcription subunit 21-like n=1 Tax=Penaeus indicus TaxID=29960 RepID=UPI00300D231B